VRFGYGTGRDEKPGSPDALAQAQTAERFGWDHITWADHSLRNRDPFLGAALWAANTSRIRVGTGVTHFATRSPIGTAIAAATIQELSGGRMVLGLGTGMSGPRSVGGRPATLAALREAIVLIKQLTAGETVTWQGAEIKFEWQPQPVPVYAAAMGPRTQQVAAEVGDGVMVNTAEPALVENALRNVAAGIERAGRAPADVDLWLRTMVALDDDRARARKAAGWYAATIAHDFAKTNLLRDTPEAQEVKHRVPQSLQDACVRLAQTYKPGQPAGDLPDELIDAFTIAGPVDYAIERLRALRDVGVGAVSLFNPENEPEEKLQFLERFAREVAPEL
jgi:alkanesulfonate monooxygenase SsuD/methylene tetrahydromethanopterin reductase-like flavin-dependent oxidoreductase (luciferase family)